MLGFHTLMKQQFVAGGKYFVLYGHSCKRQQEKLGSEISFADEA